jgi:hypothetical protein
MSYVAPVRAVFVMMWTASAATDGRLATLTMLSNDAVASATAAAGAMCWR